MVQPLREIMSHSRDIYCRIFKDKIIYEIPCYSGIETALGRAIHLEVALNPRLKYDPSVLNEPLVLKTTVGKENYKTNIRVVEAGVKLESPGTYQSR